MTASTKPVKQAPPSLPSHPVPYSVQRATAPFIVSESETSDTRAESASSESVVYVVSLRLSARGAELLQQETGRPWGEGDELDEEFEAESIAALREIAGDYGTVLRHRPKGAPAPGPNNRALRDANALVIQIREHPDVFADRYLALTRAVEELQRQAKLAADFSMVTRTQVRDLDAAHEMRIDALERIVASYEDTIRRREWLAEQRGGIE